MQTQAVRSQRELLQGRLSSATGRQGLKPP